MLVLDLDGFFGTFLYKWFEEVCYGVNGVRTPEGFDQTLLVVQICCNNINSLSSEGLSTLAVCIAGQAANFEDGVLQKSADDCTSLRTGCANDDYELRHIWDY